MMLGGFRFMLRKPGLRSFFHRQISSGVHLHHVMYKGDKEIPPLFISHGLLGSSKNWTTIAKRIRAQSGRSVIVFDARNHGKSPRTLSLGYDGMVQDLRLLFETLDIERASLMGHSMGGRTMLGFSLLHPENVEKFISVDISPLTLERTKAIIRDKFIFIKGLKSVQIPQNLPLFETRTTIKHQLEPYVQNPNIREWLSLNLYKEPSGFCYWRLNLDVLTETQIEGIADFPPEWKKLRSKAATLFICGDNSGFIQEEDHKDIQSIFCNSKIVYISDTSHWLHAEKPLEFTDIVLKFLSSKES